MSVAGGNGGAEVSGAEVSAGLFQPFLFPDFEVELVEQARVYVHNAKTVSKDEERCRLICEAMLMGMSRRSIARKFGVSRHTIAAVMEVLEERGVLAPLKQRLSARMSVVIEMGMDAMVERLEDGTVPANVLPIMVGVMVDKKALIDGDATVRVEALARPAVTVEGYLAWVKSRTAESESGVVVLEEKELRLNEGA